MKILHINTYDRGGAANACLRLHEGLLNAGIDSKVLVLYKTDNRLPEVYAYEAEIKKRAFFTRLKIKVQRILKEFKLYKEKRVLQDSDVERQHLMNLRPKGLEMISFPEKDIDITNNKYFLEADIIHLHWIADFFDYRIFFDKCKKIIVWTFHDQNPFLGVEHYAEVLLHPDNQGYPTIRQFDEYEIEIDKKYKKIKYEIFKNTPINIIALCNWMKNEILNSRMFPLAKIDIIPNGIDSKQFKCLNKKFCRELLNLPLDKKIILFVADSIDNNRKGMSYLFPVIERMKQEDFILCSIGYKQDLKFDNVNHYDLDRIQDQRLMNVAYCAVDFFVIPSLMDNLPNTVLEALLSGTPIIAFPVGGLPDMIENGKNGYLAENVSVEALTKSINYFFEQGIAYDVEKIREEAITQFDIHVQVENILEYYNIILG